jgi:putative tryptophan/tyrosine transport system substrate-binding protein
MGQSMRRREFIAAIGVAAVLPRTTRAETPKQYQMGYLGTTTFEGYAELINAMRGGLRDLNYTEGGNLSIRYKFAEGNYDRLSDLVSELVRDKVDVIVTHATPGARAAKSATSTIPIVAIGASDPVNAGLVPSLARPGGNLTGLTFFFADICAKRVELIKNVVPSIARIAVLINPTNDTFGMALSAMERTATALSIKLVPVPVKTSDGIAAAFDAIKAEKVDALAVMEEPVLNSSASYIAQLALEQRLPMVGTLPHALAGGLLAYGVDLRDLWYRSAHLIDRIFHGVKPADIPIEQAVKFQTFVNLKTAKALGLVIPPSLLAIADEAIE